MMIGLDKIALAIAGAGLLAGCAGVREHRGYVLDKELASAIQVGVDNKDSVAKTLGRPTFTGQFDANDWYYVSRSTRAFAFRRPTPYDQTVLRVRFDPAGNVASVGQTGKELAVNIDPMGGKTPTLGRRRSFFDEVFGNIGVVGAGGLGGSNAGE